MDEAIKLKESQIVSLPVDEISPNPYQPRRTFDRVGLEELARSIGEYGVIQPITVRLINGIMYELVAGERRLRASRLAGRAYIPAIVVDINDQDSAMLAIIENLQRKDLNYFEEAEGYASLIGDFSFTQERLARKVGKNQSTVANKLRLLRLNRECRALLLDNGLTERHARALLRLDTDREIAEVLGKIIEKNLNVAETEQLIERRLLARLPQEKHRRQIKTYIKDLRIFTNTIKQAVQMMNSSGVDTEYEVEESADGCLITIAVSY